VPDDSALPPARAVNVTVAGGALPLRSTCHGAVAVPQGSPYEGRILFRVRPR